MGTADLREESGLKDRKAFTLALDELQAAMIVVPTEVIYQPKLTYLWGLAEERFPEQLSLRINRQVALRAVSSRFIGSRSCPRTKRRSRPSSARPRPFTAR